MPTIATTRPRLFVTPAEVTILKERWAAKDPVLLELKRLTDAFLTEAVLDHVPNRALMFIITGDTRYSAAAIREMTRVAAKGMDAITPDQWFAVRSVLPTIAIGYDWCYGQMTNGQLANVTGALVIWGQSVWPEMNPPRKGQWGVSEPQTNYWWGFLVGTWLTALALGSQALLDLSLKKWNEVGLPYLNTRAAGGVIADGTTYGMGTLMEIGWCLRAHAKATGEDLTPPWMDAAIYACYHLSSPDLKKQAALGDQSDAPGGWQRATDRDAALANPVMHWRKRAWLDAEKPVNPSAVYQWQEALWLPSATTEPFEPLMRSWEAKGIGLVCLRTSWQPDAVAFWTRLGERGSVHAEAAAGLFQLMRGSDWLVTAAHTHSAAGTEQGADHNNCLTVDGRGQEPTFVPPAPPTVTEADRYWHVRSCNLAGAYDYKVSTTLKQPLASYGREFVFLKDSGTLIVRDVARKVSATSVVKWNLNTVKDLTPTIEPGWMTRTGQSDLHIGWVLPNHGDAGSVPVKLGSAGAISSYRLELNGLVGQSTDEFLITLQPGPLGFTPQPVTRAADGVRVGDDEFTWAADGSLSYIDHRISPRDKALNDLYDAAEKWRWGYVDHNATEEEVGAVISAARALMALVPVPVSKQAAGEEKDISCIMK